VADINGRLPVIPHEKLGADCCGCLVVQPNRGQADIVCNECRAVVRTVPVADVESTFLDLVSVALICSAQCTHCGAVNTPIRPAPYPLGSCWQHQCRAEPSGLPTLKKGPQRHDAGLDITQGKLID
jgi:hypothetical protein